MKGTKNLSRRSAIPAMNETKNQKQTNSFTTISTEDNMYNNVVLNVY